MAQRLTGEQARAWLAANPGASYIDNKTGQTIAGQKSKLAQIAGGLSQPFRTGAGVVQEAGYTLADIYNLMKGNTKDVGKRPDKYFGMSEEESKNLKEDPLKTGLKAGAGVLSYGVGGGANTAKTVIGRIGQAVGKGAVSGGLGGFGYSEKDKELEGTLKGGLLGGAIGGTLQGLGEGAKAISKARAKVVNTSSLKDISSLDKSVKSGLVKQAKSAGFWDDTLGESKSIQNYLKNRGISGDTPSQTLELMAQQFDNATELKKIGLSELGEVPSSTLKTAYSNLDDMASKSGLNLKNTKAWGTIEKTLLNPSTTKAEDIDKIIMNWNDFGRNAKGVLKANEARVYADAATALRDSLRALPSGVKYSSALDELSQVLNVQDAGTVAKAAKAEAQFGFRPPFTSGAPLKTPGIAEAGSKLRAGLGRVQETGQLVGGGFGQNVGKYTQLGQRAIPGLVGLGMQPGVVEPKSSTLQSGLTTASQPQQQMTVEEAITMAAQTMPGASESEIMSLAKMYLDQGSGSGLKVSAKDKNNAISGLSSLNQLEALLSSNQSLLTPQILGQGDLAELAGSTEFKQYQALARNVADIVGRIRTGAQMNESEIKLYMEQFLPRWYDDVQTKQTKLQQLRDYLSGISSGQVATATVVQ